MGWQLVKSRVKATKRAKDDNGATHTASSTAEDECVQVTGASTDLAMNPAPASSWAQQWDALVETVAIATAEAEALQEQESAANGTSQHLQRRYSSLVKSTQRIKDPYSRSNSTDGLVAGDSVEQSELPSRTVSTLKETALSKCNPAPEFAKLSEAGFPEESLRALCCSYSSVDVLAASQSTAAIAPSVERQLSESAATACHFSETEVSQAANRLHVGGSGTDSSATPLGAEQGALPAAVLPAMAAAALTPMPSLPRAPPSMMDDPQRLLSQRQDSNSERTPRGRHRRGKPIEGTLHWDRKLEPLAGDRSDVEGGEGDMAAALADAASMPQNTYSPRETQSIPPPERFSERRNLPENQSIMLSRPEAPPGGYLRGSPTQPMLPQQFINPVYASRDAVARSTAEPSLARSLRVESNSAAPDWGTAAAVLTDVDSHNTSRASSVADTHYVDRGSNGEGDYRAALAAAGTTLPARLPEVMPTGLQAGTRVPRIPPTAAVRPSIQVPPVVNGGLEHLPAESPPSGGIRVRSVPLTERVPSSGRYTPYGGMETVPEDPTPSRRDSLPPGTPLDGSTESSSSSGGLAEEVVRRARPVPVARGASEAAALAAAVESTMLGRPPLKSRHLRTDSDFFSPLSRGAPVQAPMASQYLPSSHPGSAPASQPASVASSGAPSPRRQTNAEQDGYAMPPNSNMPHYAPQALAPPLPGALPEPLLRTESWQAAQRRGGYVDHRRQPSNAVVDAVLQANAPGHAAFRCHEMLNFESARREAEAPRHRRNTTMDPTNDPLFFSPLSQGKAADELAYSSVAKAVYRDVSGPLGTGAGAPTGPPYPGYPCGGSSSGRSTVHGLDHGIVSQQHLGEHGTPRHLHRRGRQLPPAYPQEHLQRSNVQQPRTRATDQPQMHFAQLHGETEGSVGLQGHGHGGFGLQAMQHYSRDPTPSGSPSLSRAQSMNRANDVGYAGFGSNMPVEEIDYPASYQMRSAAVPGHSSAAPSRTHKGQMSQSSRGFGSDLTVSSQAASGQSGRNSIASAAEKQEIMPAPAPQSAQPQPGGAAPPPPPPPPLPGGALLHGSRAPGPPAAPARDPAAYQVPSAEPRRAESAQMPPISMRVQAVDSDSSRSSSVTPLQRPRPPTAAEIQAAASRLRKVGNRDENNRNTQNGRPTTTSPKRTDSVKAVGQLPATKDAAFPSKRMPAPAQDSTHNSDEESIAAVVAPKTIKAVDLASIRSSVLMSLGSSGNKGSRPAAAAVIPQQAGTQFSGNHHDGSDNDGPHVSSGMPDGAVYHAVAHGIMARRTALAADSDDDWD